MRNSLNMPHSYMNDWSLFPSVLPNNALIHSNSIRLLESNPQMAYQQTPTFQDEAPEINE